MGDGTWTWRLRWRCLAIADLDDSVPGTLTVVLCRRWRWHRGACH